MKALDDRCSFLHSESWRPSKLFALGLSPINPGLRSFNQQIALEFGHSCDNLHGHFSSWTGEINTTQGKAMHPHTAGRQLLDGCPNIHRIAPQAIELGDNQDIPRLQPVNQLNKAWPFFCRH